MRFLKEPVSWIVVIAALAYFALVPSLLTKPRSSVSLEMQVALPRFVQILMAGGDRYLAANLADFRALVASTEKMNKDNFQIQAKIQSDAAWLNPAHEDNYYIAAAILPWNGEVAASQKILRQAAIARPFDWQPAFYYAFGELHFNKNPLVAAEWLRRAASSTNDEMEKIQLQQLAAQWAAKGEDLNVAIQLHRAMAKESRHKQFASFLEKRAIRLENLLTLDQAIARYREETGRSPSGLSELVDRQILSAIPTDPFGAGYVIDASGRAQVQSMPPAGAGQTNGKKP